MSATKLSPEALRALRALERTHGRLWKRELRALWSRAVTLSDAETALYRLRNSHGPAWLSRFVLAKATGGES